MEPDSESVHVDVVNGIVIWWESFGIRAGTSSIWRYSLGDEYLRRHITVVFILQTYIFLGATGRCISAGTSV